MDILQVITTIAALGLIGVGGIKVLSWLKKTFPRFCNSDLPKIKKELDEQRTIREEQIKTAEPDEKIDLFNNAIKDWKENRDE
jgi:hypothetical protein